MENPKILFAASEAVPFAKSGGLADVAGTLPRELLKLGQDVRLVMPKYKSIPKSYTDKMKYAGYIYVDVGWRHQYCAVLKLVQDGLTVYFIDNEYYFKRDGLYGYPDEAEQFTFFSKALIQMLPLVGFKPDIIHCNDWQTGIVSLLLLAHYKKDDFYRDIKTVYTIHNLKYQGIFPKTVLQDLMGVGWEYFHIDGIEFYNCVNYMKAGIAFSDVITTVSKTYAREIRYDYFGERLNGLINKRYDRVFGILNGIDEAENDPAADQRLFAQYDAENPAGKAVNKQMLQRLLGLHESAEVPLIGIVSRLVDQKGFDLIAHVLHELLELDVQMAVLGAGEYKYEEMFRYAAAQYPGKVSVSLGYDGLLAQRIYAGADMFLMPSLFEPCGLSQLFSLRYGTVPIVRETGGLNDTVKSFNETTGEGDGFTFSSYNAHDMLYTIKRALHFFQDKDVWSRIVKNAMGQDFSWRRSAEEYINLYKRLTGTW